MDANMAKKKNPEELLKSGRKTRYTEALADEICTAIASSGLGICELAFKNRRHWPSRQVIYDWRKRHPEFDYKYNKAKELTAM